jgi:hypothetical protein
LIKLGYTNNAWIAQIMNACSIKESDDSITQHLVWKFV